MTNGCSMGLLIWLAGGYPYRASREYVEQRMARKQAKQQQATGGSPTEPERLQPDQEAQQFPDNSHRCTSHRSPSPPNRPGSESRSRSGSSRSGSTPADLSPASHQPTSDPSESNFATLVDHNISRDPDSQPSRGRSTEARSQSRASRPGLQVAPSTHGFVDGDADNVDQRDMSPPPSWMKRRARVESPRLKGSKKGEKSFSSKKWDSLDTAIWLAGGRSHDKARDYVQSRRGVKRDSQKYSWSSSKKENDFLGFGFAPTSSSSQNPVGTVTNGGSTYYDTTATSAANDPSYSSSSSSYTPTYVPRSISWSSASTATPSMSSWAAGPGSGSGSAYWASGSHGGEGTGHGAATGAGGYYGAAENTSGT
ncbi:hypothetical protein VTK26DRAFT_2054 [Humicola hyalothermophila]